MANREVNQDELAGGRPTPSNLSQSEEEHGRPLCQVRHNISKLSYRDPRLRFASN